MEQNIQDLVASIRKEGIDKARKEADAIISKAKEEAEGIIREAEKSRDKMIADAEKAISLERTSSEAAIRQAARDVSLSLKKSIEDEYTRILSGKIAAALDKDGLIAIIKAVLSGDMGGKAVEPGHRSASHQDSGFLRKTDRGIWRFPLISARSLFTHIFPIR